MDENERKKAKELYTNIGKYLYHKRYTEIAEYFDYIGWLIWIQLASYEADCLFPHAREHSPKRELTHELDRKTTRKDAAHIFEVAVAVGRDAEADLLADRLLLTIPDPSTPVRLVLSAIRAGRKDRATMLLDHWFEKLTSPQRRRLTQLLKREK
jgi:hypothetical protein